MNHLSNDDYIDEEGLITPRQNLVRGSFWTFVDLSLTDVDSETLRVNYNDGEFSVHVRIWSDIVEDNLTLWVIDRIRTYIEQDIAISNSVVDAWRAILARERNNRMHSENGNTTINPCARACHKTCNGSFCGYCELVLERLKREKSWHPTKFKHDLQMLQTFWRRKCTVEDFGDYMRLKKDFRPRLLRHKPAPQEMIDWDVLKIGTRSQRRMEAFNEVKRRVEEVVSKFDTNVVEQGGDFHAWFGEIVKIVTDNSTLISIGVTVAGLILTGVVIWLFIMLWKTKPKSVLLQALKIVGLIVLGLKAANFGFATVCGVVNCGILAVEKLEQSIEEEKRAANARKIAAAELFHARQDACRGGHIHRSTTRVEVSSSDGLRRSQERARPMDQEYQAELDRERFWRISDVDITKSETVYEQGGTDDLGEVLSDVVAQLGAAAMPKEGKNEKGWAPGIYASFVKEARSVVGLIRDAKFVVELLQPLVEWLVRQWYRIVYDKEWIPWSARFVYQRITPLIAEFHVIRADPNFVPMLNSNIRRQQDIINLAKRFKEVEQELATRKDSPRYLEDFKKARATLDEWVMTIERAKKVAKPRAEPLHIQFVGKPGTGKTTATRQIAHDVHATLASLYNYIDPEWNDNLVWSWKCENEYYDGYEEQPIVMIDDIFSSTDKDMRQSQAQAIMRMINTDPLQLHMSSVADKKGVYFTSKLVLSTRNGDLDVSNIGLTDVAAYHRRVHFLCEALPSATPHDSSSWRYNLLGPQLDIRYREITYTELLSLIRGSLVYFAERERSHTVTLTQGVTTDVEGARAFFDKSRMNQAEKNRADREKFQNVTSSTKLAQRKVYNGPRTSYRKQDPDEDRARKESDQPSTPIFAEAERRAVIASAPSISDSALLYGEEVAPQGQGSSIEMKQKGIPVPTDEEIDSLIFSIDEMDDWARTQQFGRLANWFDDIKESIEKRDVNRWLSREFLVARWHELKNRNWRARIKERFHSVKEWTWSTWTAFVEWLGGIGDAVVDHFSNLALARMLAKSVDYVQTFVTTNVYVKIAAGLGILGTIAAVGCGVYQLVKWYTGEEEGKGEEIVDQSYGEKDIAMVKRMIPKANPQKYSEQQQRVVAQLGEKDMPSRTTISRNLFLVKSFRPGSHGSPSIGQLLFVAGKWAITATHVAHAMKQSVSDIIIHQKFVDGNGEMRVTEYSARPDLLKFIQIPNREVTMVEFPGVRDARNILGHFETRSDVDNALQVGRRRVYVSHRLSTGEQNDMNIDSVSYVQGTVYEKEPEFRFWWRYTAVTDAGMSGAPIWSTDETSGPRYLIGVHSGASLVAGYGSVVDAETISQYLPRDALAEREMVPQLLHVPVLSCPPCNQAEPVGVLAVGHSSTGKNLIVPSPLSKWLQAMPPELGESTFPRTAPTALYDQDTEPMLRKFKDWGVIRDGDEIPDHPTHIRPRSQAYLRVPGHHEVDPALISATRDRRDVTNLQNSVYIIYTPEEAVFGDQASGLPPLDLTTSIGINFTDEPSMTRERLVGLSRGEKRRTTYAEWHPRLREEIERSWELINRRGYPEFVCVDSLKGERRKLKRVLNGDTRMYYAGSFIHLIVARMMFGWLDVNEKETHTIDSSAVGTNPLSHEWRETWLRLQRFPKLLEFDSVNFDLHNRPEVLDDVLRYHGAVYALECELISRTKLFNPTKDLFRHAFFALGRASYVAYHVNGSILYKSHSVAMSGAYRTSAWNSKRYRRETRIIHAAWFAMNKNRLPREISNLTANGAYNRLMDGIFYGDDSVLGVDNLMTKYLTPYEWTVYAKSVLGSVLTNPDKSLVTPETPYKTTNQATLLKRGYRNENGIVFAPLEVATIEESLHWVTKGAYGKSIASDTVRSALLEAVVVGKEYYDNLYRRLEYACAKAGVEFDPLDYEAVYKMLTE